MTAANVVTWSGRSIIVGKLKALGTEPLNVGWGIGATAVVNTSAISDVNMFNPATTESRIGGTSSILSTNTTALADTYQVVSTLTAGGARVITEVGLFDSNTSLSPQCNLASALAISTGILSIGATTTSAFPAASNNYYAQIDNEVVLVTSGQATSSLTITRGQLGSANATHTVNSIFIASGDGGAHAANASIGGETWIPTGANGGSMFVHADFAAINLSLNDSIQFTLKVQFT